MSESLVGRLLGGRYRVLRPLGEGGMGAVYEAVQENLGRRVAVKVLVAELRDDVHYIERFRREADAAARLMHPHIVQVTDFVQAPGEPVFIVMEMLEGESLLAALQRERMSVARASRIAVQLLSALEAAHAAGIVHRDLKPANVFLVPIAGGGDLVKLLDFGIAKLQESDGYRRLTQTGVLIGTPRYAAPEQITARPSLDARTDLYSAGVLLFGMLAGRPPFTSSGARLLIDIQEVEPPELVSLAPGVPPGLAAAVRRAMRKRPEDRFPSAREMIAKIEPFTRVDPSGALERAPIPGAAESTAPGFDPGATRAPKARAAAPAAAATSASRPAALAASPAQAALPPAPSFVPAQGAPPQAFRVGLVPPAAAPHAHVQPFPPTQGGPPARPEPTPLPPTVAMHAVPFPVAQSPRASWPEQAPRPVAQSPGASWPEPARQSRAPRQSEPRRSHAPARDAGAAIRWGLVIGLLGLFVLIGLAIGGVLVWRTMREERQAQEREDTPPPAPSQATAPASVEVSAAARRLGPECVEYEQLACGCGPDVAASWCEIARGENLAGADHVAPETIRERCRVSANGLRAHCVPVRRD